MVGTGVPIWPGRSPAGSGVWRSGFPYDTVQFRRSGPLGVGTGVPFQGEVFPLDLRVVVVWFRHPGALCRVAVDFLEGVG